MGAKILCIICQGHKTAREIPQHSYSKTLFLTLTQWQRKTKIVALACTSNGPNFCHDIMPPTKNDAYTYHKCIHTYYEMVNSEGP